MECNETQTQSASQVTDLHAKSQVNIYKRLEKKSGKPFYRRNLLSPKPVILPKITGA